MDVIFLGHAVEPPEVDFSIGDVVRRLLNEFNHPTDFTAVLCGRPFVNNTFMTELLEYSASIDN